MKDAVTAVILAAGQGKRFWPFVQDKNLFPFLGKPFIHHTIGETLPKEVSEIILVGNTENKKELSSMAFGVPVTFVVQKEGDGMADAILAAKSKIQHKPVLVIIADDVAHTDVYRTVIEKANMRHFGVLPVWHATTHFPGGYIVYNGQRPVGIMEKPPEGKEPSQYVYFGGQYIENADVLLAELESLPRAKSDDVYERALTSLMKSQEFVTVPFEEKFASLKYPWHVLDVMAYLLRNRLVPRQGKKVEIHNNVSIEGPVYFGDNVRIFENTKIVGPVYIGDNTIIGNNNMIRESFIGRDCVTGFNTDITRSYIGDECWFHSNYIGDSVLEGNISMGSGSVLANLRLDEGEISSVVHGTRVNTRRTKLGAMIAKHVRIGVNVSVMPGVKIGTNSMIGAATLLAHDVPDQSFCTAKSGVVMHPNKKSIKPPSSRNEFRAKI